MKIVNYVHIGDEVKNMDDLNPEEKRDIALKLNIQSLAPLGYVLRIKEEDPQAANSGHVEEGGYAL